jgi:hypothetical protein
MACADPATSPSRSVLPNGASKLITNTPRYPTSPPLFDQIGIQHGEIQLCKRGVNGSGQSFNFTMSVNGAGSVGIPGGPLAAGSCRIIFRSTIGSANPGPPDLVVITEGTDPANWALTDIIIDQLLFIPVNYSTAQLADDDFAPDARSATVKIDLDMARRVTFQNTFTPPPTGCTYTKGWYRNNGSSTVIAVDGRSIAQAQAIFKATPGQPGSVTFGGNNTLLNLYQQLLAALNNLGGDANEDDGPAAVDAAIDAAQNGTGGTGLNITTTLTQGQMSALITTLTAFNEGTYAGWPHCVD